MSAAGELLVKDWPDRGVYAEDLRLVRAVLEGEPSAFDALVRQHGSRVTSVVRRVLADPNELEDAVQETFLRAYQNLRRFRGAASLSTWLVQIALNVCRDRRRGFWRRRVVVGGDPTVLDTAPSGRPQPGDVLLLQHAIDAAVAQLPEKLRLPFVLHAFEELSGAEVAAVLGWSESTVWTRIYSARRKLQERLGDLLGS